MDMSFIGTTEAPGTRAWTAKARTRLAASAKTFRLTVWGATAFVATAFLAQPVSVAAQLALGVTVIVCMIALWRFGRGPMARWCFLSLGSLVVLRYVFWRATSTLPPIDQPFNFGLGLLLILAELYCVLILVISLVINADPLDRKPLERGDDDILPTVDVFIPSYNEDEYILATTIAAAKSMDYPKDKLTVWLLDDGGTEQKVNDGHPEKAAAAMARRVSLTQLCADMGALYLTRDKNEHAKAGNMNNGLKHATGEIVVVFDADHAPFKSFLRETVGHFAKDPKLFLVQTPHVFLNPDPIERNLRTWQSMPSENEMFYSVTQRGLDKWDGSFFCGSAALLRREALDIAGGFSGITITEDCETAFELHAKGWHSVYVDKPLIAGLQPESFDSFIGQRSRWCQGMFQILLLKNPLFKKGLKPIQKLAYLSSMTFWFFPLPRMVFTLAPLLHIFFDVKIFVSSMDEALAYTATYMVVNLMLQNYLYGRVRWPFMSELYEYVQGVYLAKAIVSVVLKPRKPTFNVTAKGLSLDEDHLSSLARPFFMIFAVLFVGAATAFYRYWVEPGAELMLIVGLWTTFNLVIAGVALGVVSERREPDRFPRLAIKREGMLTVGERTIAVTIHSVSAGGCAVRLAEADASGHPAFVAMLENAACSLAIRPLDGGADHEPMTIALVHATSGDDATAYGFSFATMGPKSYLALADLMYGDPDAILRFLTKRRAHKNLFVGSWRFLRWGVLEPLRATGYVVKLARATILARGTKMVIAPATQAVETPIIEPVTIQALAVEALVVETVVAEASVLEASMVETTQVATTPIVAAPVALETVVPSLTLVSVSAAAEGPVDVAIDIDFDALATELVAASVDDLRVDATADWMNALLDLAAREMRETSPEEERTYAPATVAA